MGRTVLVVDDEPEIVELLADLLEGAGYRVHRAYDGPSVLAAVDAARPDLVIIDALLPGLNGITLAAGLHEVKPPIPVILISAAVADPGLPGLVFVPKPFNFAHLRAAIARVLPDDGASGQPPATNDA